MDEENSNEDQTTSIKQMEQMLENEIKKNSKEKWNKLDNSLKYKKLMEFVDNYETSEKDKLRNFLKNALYNNQFSKVKDVVYDNEKFVITSIPGLEFINENYIIQNSKRISTSRNLPKKSFTKKNKININDKTNNK